METEYIYNQKPQTPVKFSAKFGFGEWLKFEPR